LYEFLWCRNLQIAFTCHFKQGTECLEVVLGEKQRLAVGHGFRVFFGVESLFLRKKVQFLMGEACATETP
jgi:hypothetical protein